MHICLLINIPTYHPNTNRLIINLLIDLINPLCVDVLMMILPIGGCVIFWQPYLEGYNLCIHVSIRSTLTLLYPSIAKHKHTSQSIHPSSHTPTHQPIHPSFRLCMFVNNVIESRTTYSVNMFANWFITSYYIICEKIWGRYGEEESTIKKLPESVSNLSVVPFFFSWM